MRVQRFNEFLIENEINKELFEMRFTSAGIKELLGAVFFNWDKLKTSMKKDMNFGSFKEVLDFIKHGDQEEQDELERFVKGAGIEIPAFESLNELWFGTVMNGASDAGELCESCGIHPCECTEGAAKKIKQIGEDKVPGGLADELSIEDIAKRHNVSVGELQDQLNKGIKVEMEHTDDKEVATEIASDHLMEDPNYYDKLEKIEPQHENVNEGKKVLADREGNKDTGNKIIDKYLKGMRQGTVQVAWNMISVKGGVVDHNNNIDFTVAYDNFKDEYMVFGNRFETLSVPGNDIKNDEDLHKLIGSAVNGHTFSR